jgi:predicted nuclease of predicted toxin-antitoxin system
VRFLVDAQLPPALARHLVSLGHEASHVVDAGLLVARDQEIWRYAELNDAVLVTKDEDFVTLRALNPLGPAVVWVRIGNATKRNLIARFAVALPAVVAAIERGETIIQIPNA